MRASRRDSILVALLAISFACLAWTAVKVFRRSSAKPAGAVAAPAMGAAPSPARTTEPAAVASAPVSRPRRALPADTLSIRDVPEPGASESAAVGEPEPAATPPRAGMGSASAGFEGAAGASSAEISSARAGVAASQAAAPAATTAPTTEPRPSPSSARVSAPGGAADVRAPASSDELGAATPTAGLLTQARKLKVSGNKPEETPDFSNPADVRAAFLEQQAVDERVDHSVREALGRLGPAADIEDQRQAASDALAAAGQPRDEISITNALAKSQQPPAGSPDAPPPPAPGALDAAINGFAASFPAPSAASGSPGDAAPQLPVGPEYVPPEKPPRGVGEAYKNYASAFATALKNFGVQPWDILAIAQQETGFGRNMGHVPLPQGLAKRRADLAAAIQLDANKQLPAPWQNLRGSETGAMGPFQFEPATQLRAGKGNPFDWNNQISYSVPHLLILNGYKPNDPVAQRKAFGRYYGDGNPNGKYALSVAGHAAAIRPVIEGEKP